MEGYVNVKDLTFKKIISPCLLVKRDYQVDRLTNLLQILSRSTFGTFSIFKMIGDEIYIMKNRAIVFETGYLISHSLDEATHNNQFYYDVYPVGNYVCDIRFGVLQKENEAFKVTNRIYKGLPLGYEVGLPMRFKKAICRVLEGLPGDIIKLIIDLIKACNYRLEEDYIQIRKYRYAFRNLKWVCLNPDDNEVFSDIIPNHALCQNNSYLTGLNPSDEVKKLVYNGKFKSIEDIIKSF